MPKITQAAQRLIRPVTVKVSNITREGISVIPYFKYDGEEFSATDMCLKLPIGQSIVAIEVQRTDYVPPIFCFWRKDEIIEVDLSIEIFLDEDVCIGKTDIKVTLNNDDVLERELFEVKMYKEIWKVRVI